MKVVVFGLTISSSWGNGHATLWRGLCSALSRRGHEVVFFEKDVAYYASNRDLTSLPGGGELYLYSDFAEVSKQAGLCLDEADLAVVTSYCPDGQQASRLVSDSRAAIRAFYDLDAPITIERIRKGERVDYLPPNGLCNFDLVLSYTGGRSLDDLRDLLGARFVAPLYGSVDPANHYPVAAIEEYRSDLSYLGTYAADRQQSLEALFLEPARCLPHRRFVIGGAQYPQTFPWTENISFVRHMPPALHPAFFCSSRATLNVTRAAMAACGYCPSGRLFEAAACGVPVLSDVWEGLDTFFTPGKELIAVSSPGDVIDSIQLSDHELADLARAARDRTLAQHTSEHRVIELEQICESVLARRSHTRPERQDKDLQPKPQVWGIIPAAGVGSRIQPLAFSKELLPVGSRIEGDTERPRAVSEYLIERMIAGGATKLCFVISPGKSDILEYYASGVSGAEIVYAVQPRPGGLCDAIFRALPVIPSDASVVVGLPDTIWFPEDGLCQLPDDYLSFLTFHVEHPEFFDAVTTSDDGFVTEVEVKSRNPRSNWIWGAFKMPGHVYHELYSLWRRPERGDEYFGTLVNAYLQMGGRAVGIRAGKAYVDVGTLHGYREATRLLNGAPEARLPVEEPHREEGIDVGQSAGGRRRTHALEHPLEEPAGSPEDANLISVSSGVAGTSTFRP
ncbi:MAG TPA: glycosyltransferase [Acidisarcina sp.]